ncbi:CRISPR system precrRNA processing endoribonuclease RAMP protein Cas6, partial [Methylorubrum podarium]|uniref:CRISPR system precrRNA processing endoribonuclease RAMP protein Cas6 n=2 Tax=Bacteria TaxID=2 RepID=UPI001EE28985
MVSPRTLVEVWSEDVVRVVCARPSDLEDHFDLALRIRGALGGALSVAGPVLGARPDPAHRPNAFELLYGSLPPRRQGEPLMGRPMAIDADVIGDEVHVEVRLFGGSGFWLEQVRDGLLAALEDGVALRPSGQRVPFSPLTCTTCRIVPEPAPSRVGEAVLTFLTPLAIRSGSRPSAAPGALLSALQARMAGLAPWQGVTLAFSAMDARAAAAALHVEAEAWRPIAFRRFSRRAPGAPIPVMGFCGRLRLTGALDPIGPLLHLARRTHLGSNAALGLG